MNRFFELTLRTLDVNAARTFYASVLGACGPHIVQLHEQAVARGARPHWLGYIEVADVDRAAAAFVERGATLFARWVNPEGLEAAVVRDPGGAMLALAKPPESARAADSAPQREVRPEVGWYLLNTPDVRRAQADYGELFGWDCNAGADSSTEATAHPFAWRVGEPAVGAMFDIRGRPEIHPHWLFCFRVPSVERSSALVRAQGGVVAAQVALADGALLAVCDDAQGAAFGLWQAS